ncbi:MAG: hypothetical protein Q4B48_07765 [Syntrophomonadaceae bacterium]|nr:hypothetical protein [Syntrophomonadaceae bacterium]
MQAAYPIVMSRGKRFIVVYVSDFDISPQGRDYADAMAMASDACAATNTVIDVKKRKHLRTAR